MFLKERTNPVRAWMLVAALPMALLAGCGGGGGGGAAPSTVTGTILLVSSGQPPDPAATVTIGGQSATTGTDGSFVLRNVPSNATQVKVTATGAVTLTQTLPTLTANGMTDLGNVFLSDTGYTSTVSGTVERADTLAPIAGATVKLSGQTVVTDASGAFTMSALPVGLGRNNAKVGTIIATGFDSKDIYLDPELSASPPNNALDPFLLALPVGSIPSGPTTIRGTVRLSTVALASGAEVRLLSRPAGTILATQTTGTDGAYGFWVLPGQYTVQVTYTGYQPASADVTLAATDTPITTDITLHQ